MEKESKSFKKLPKQYIKMLFLFENKVLLV